MNGGDWRDLVLPVVAAVLCSLCVALYLLWLF